MRNSIRVDGYDLFHLLQQVDGKHPSLLRAHAVVDCLTLTASQVLKKQQTNEHLTFFLSATKKDNNMPNEPIPKPYEADERIEHGAGFPHHRAPNKTDSHRLPNNNQWDAKQGLKK